MTDLERQFDDYFPDLAPGERDALLRFGQALAGGRALLFVGAGISIPSGLMSGRQLIEAFRRFTGSDSDDLRALCSRYAAQQSPHALRARLLELLDDWNRPLAPVHQLIPRLNLRQVVTTNVDRLIEEGCRQLRRPFAVFSLPEDLSYARPDLLSILKIHGTLEHPHTLVFSDADYARIMDEERRFEERLKQLFQEHEVLTVGFTADEPDFNPITGWLAERHDGRRVIALHLETAQADACRREGVLPILLRDYGTRRSYERIPLLLGLLGGLAPGSIPLGLRQVDRRRNPFRRLEAYTEQDAGRLAGRDAFLAQTLAALGEYRNLLLFGDSGAGKTSFARAGLSPAWERRHGTTVRLETVAADLAARWSGLLADLPADHPALLILDQFERFFDDAGQREAQVRFFGHTLPATGRTRPRLHCLFVIRRDRLADLHPFRQRHPGLFQESLELPQLSAEQAEAVLLDHFGAGGYTLDRELAAGIVGRTLRGATPYLPALQLYGYAQFEQAEARRLAGAPPDSIGIADAVEERDVLAAFVNEALQVFAPGLHHNLLLRVLRRLTLHGRRQQLALGRLREEFPDPDEARAVLDLLVDKRLVVFLVERDAYELVHDALVEAVEAGPLAVHPDYRPSEIRAYLIDPERRARTNPAQRLNLLRYSIRQGLPCAPWLNLLEEAGFDGGEALIRLVRDADPLVSARAMDYLRRHGALCPAADEEPLRAHLLAVVMAAMADEEEDQEKGESALRLLLALGLDIRATTALLDYLDPFRHLAAGETLVSERQLNDYDYRLMDIYLAPLLRAAPADDLAHLLREAVSRQPFEIGPERYVALLVELGRRGAVELLLRRCEALVADSTDEIDLCPECVVKALARLSDEGPLGAPFDDLRESWIRPFLHLRDRSLLPDVMAVLAQLGRRRPEAAILIWLQGFSQYGRGGEHWPLVRDVAAGLIARRPALIPFMLRLSATRSTQESLALAEVLLAAEPGDGFLGWEEDSALQDSGLVTPFAREVARSLDPIRLMAILRPTPLDIWRAGRWWASRDDLSPEFRWQAFLETAAAALDQAKQIARRHGLKARCNPQWDDPKRLDRCQQRLEKLFEETFVVRIEQARQELMASITELLHALNAAEAGNSALRIERLRQGMALILTLQLPLVPPIGRWPPLIWRPEYSPEVAALIDELERIAEGSAGTGIVEAARAVRRQFRELGDRVEEDISFHLATAQWLIQNAAAAAAESGAERLTDWFASLKNTLEQRDFDTPPQSRSAIRWALLQQDGTAPWAVLYNDPRELGCVEVEESRVVVECVTEHSDPLRLSPAIREWVAEYLKLALEDEDEGLCESEDSAAALEQLCRTGWAELLAQSFETEGVERLLQSLFPACHRAALQLWPHLRSDRGLEAIVDLALSGPKALRPTAAEALEAWFAGYRP